MKRSRTAPTSSPVASDLPKLRPILHCVVARDREKFAEDLAEVVCAKSDADCLRAFWELVVRWEGLYPTVIQFVESRLIPPLAGEKQSA